MLYLFLFVHTRRKPFPSRTLPRTLGLPYHSVPRGNPEPLSPRTVPPYNLPALCNVCFFLFKFTAYHAIAQRIASIVTINMMFGVFGGSGLPEEAQEIKNNGMSFFSIGIKIGLPAHPRQPPERRCRVCVSLATQKTA